MTVTPRKHSSQAGSSTNKDSSIRSGPVQMDEVVALRFKPSPEESVSLAPSLESINLEDSHYAQLRVDLECDAQNLEAESWSVAVDQNYLKALNKEAVERQDVIYELIQTEMHHVRTLKILLYVYMHELGKSSLIEENKLEGLFLGVAGLLTLHQRFLNCLKVHQNQSQEGSPNDYQITQLGDILISQFSGAWGEGMIKCYSVFCSHHTEATSFYKEQLQNNKKLQILNRKIGQLPLVRRLGIPECFLLVAQRITKYPILVERIIQNTKADTDEYNSLVQGLELIKETISQVNNCVCEYEKAARLNEIGLRLEPKSHGRLKDGQLFRKEDLLKEDKTLLYEGIVTWKSSSRQKDIHAVLLSDVLLLLQEKDQKLVFAAVDNKPPVISLQRLIVREVAHEDKAMYLICACTDSMPEMYEIHTGSKEECITWMGQIREAVNRYPEEEQYRKLTARLQQFYDILKTMDDQIMQCLMDKQQIFASLYETVMEQETPHKGLLLRGDATDLQQGETLLKGALNEVEYLQTLLFSKIKDPNLMDESQMQGGLLMRAEAFGVADSNLATSTLKTGDAAERPGSSKGSPDYSSHTTSDPQPEVVYHSESLEQSADDDTTMPNCNLTSSHIPELYDRVILLAQRLYSLQAVIAQQDSRIELQHTFQSKSKQPARHYSSELLEQEKQRSLEKQKEEVINMHKMQAQYREEQQRWEKDRERQKVQIETLEAQLQQREEECRKWEEKLSQEKAELEELKKNYQQDLERLRESTKSVDKDKERLNQERVRLEQLQEKIKKNIPNPGYPNYDDSSKHWSLASYQSFSGRIVNGGGTLPPKIQVLPPIADSTEVPPKVPLRKESMIQKPASKSELPIQLISTTNQVHKPVPVQQQIPAKLAVQPKGKEKGHKPKRTHQRTHSAANIDVNQVLPIRVTGKEGGSLRAKRNGGHQSVYKSGAFNPLESPRNVKPSQSFSAHKASRSEDPPPVPPPFPKDILKTGKQKLVLL